jgi:hypothetical protein
VGVLLGALLGAPLTLHAANGLAAQYNAVSISEAMKAGTCKPILTYICPVVKQIKIVCQLVPGIDLWAGLIIGTAIPEQPVVVTGFAARWSYWQRSFMQDGCVLAAP